MSQTYQAVLKDNRIEWTGDAPAHLPSDRPVRVQITLLDPVAPTADKDRGKRMAAILGRIAARGGVAGITDPSKWEREQREDRPLPGREP